MTIPPSLTKAKELVSLQRYGTLSTISKSNAGHPFGSLAAYDLEGQGAIVIYVSRIAEHYRNVREDPRVSLFVADPFVLGDPQAFARATLILELEEVSDGQREEVAARYAERFPEAVKFELAHDFVFLRGIPSKVRWIGGFGEICWIDGGSFASAPLDPIAYRGLPIIRHMHEDHRDALKVLVAWRTGRAFDPSMLMMNRVRSNGFEILAPGIEPVSFSFPVICYSAEEFRASLVTMVREARGAGARPVPE